MELLIEDTGVQRFICDHCVHWQWHEYFDIHEECSTLHECGWDSKRFIVHANCWKNTKGHQISVISAKPSTNELGEKVMELLIEDEEITEHPCDHCVYSDWFLHHDLNDHCSLVHECGHDCKSFIIHTNCWRD